MTTPSADAPGRTPALDEQAMQWVVRGLWGVCVAVYLIVFVGGIQSGNDELGVVARAAAFTLVAAILGRFGLNLLGRASVPAEMTVPLDDEDGRLGSRFDLGAGPNVAGQEAQADAV
jgi:hypothetical protein